MSGSYTYVGKHPAQNECFGIYGIFNMKFAYRNREFWCKGYYIDTVGKNTKAIKTYIFASAPSAQISLWPALPRRNKLCIACSDFSIQKCAVCLTTFLCVFLRLNVCF